MSLVAQVSDVVHGYLVIKINISNIKKNLGNVSGHFYRIQIRIIKKQIQTLHLLLKHNP